MNKPSKTVATHSAICAVCFNEHKLDNGSDRPTRHGFSAHQVRHGHTGGWHTGPCFGVQFPHYGISADGTKEALRRAQGHRQGLLRAIEIHAEHPVLTYTQTGQKGGAWGQKVSRDFAVQPGAKAQRLDPDSTLGYNYWSEIPAYEVLWTIKQQRLAAELSNVESAIAFLAGKIDTWAPASANLVPAAVIVVHQAAFWKGRGATVTGKCSMWSMRAPARTPNVTADASLVTCQRCKK